VDGDGEQAFFDATRRLQAMGHRRIVHIAASASLTFSYFRRRGYEAMMTGAGLTPDVAEAEFSQEGGFRAALAVLTRPERPTALLCSTDTMAIGAMLAARSLGLAVPGDVSIMGHDNLPASEHTEPPLTTMELPLAETGRTLAEMALARIAGVRAETLTRVMPVQFVMRGSIGPAPG
jgi:LacI family transcriptional regulator